MAAIVTGLFGPNGSGKTFEAVEHHVVQSLIIGQPVATNIDGIEQNIDKLAAYVFKRAKPGIYETADDVKALVTILPARREELFAPGVWPNPDNWDGPSVIKRGSTVVLDECSAVLGDKPPQHVLIYITEQRHGLDDRGHQGRMVLISQAWAHIHASVRACLALTYLFSEYHALAPFMKILRPLGLGYDYRISVYTSSGRDPISRKPDNLIGRRRNPAIFALYNSVDGAIGEQGGLDKRATIFGNTFVMVLFPIAIAVALYAGNSLYKRFFSAATPAATTTATATPGARPAPLSLPPVSGESDPFSDESKKYRLVGTQSNAGVTSYYVAGPDGIRTLYLDELAAVNQRGSRIELVMRDKTKITEFSGRSYTSSKPQTPGGSNAQTTNSSSTTAAAR